MQRPSNVSQCGLIRDAVRNHNRHRGLCRPVGTPVGTRFCSSADQSHGLDERCAGFGRESDD